MLTGCLASAARQNFADLPAHRYRTMARLGFRCKQKPCLAIGAFGSDQRGSFHIPASIIRRMSASDIDPHSFFSASEDDDKCRELLPAPTTLSDGSRISFDVLRPDDRAAALGIFSTAVEEGNCLPYASMSEASSMSTHRRYFVARCRPPTAGVEQEVPPLQRIMLL